MLAACGQPENKQAAREFERPMQTKPIATFEVQGSISPKALAVLADGRFVVLSSVTEGEKNLVELQLLSAGGKNLWTKTFAGTGTALYAGDMVVLPDGALLLTGDSRVSESQLQGWLCKVDTTGNIIWQKNYPEIDMVGPLALNANGGPALLHGNSSLHVSLINSKNGNLEWTVPLDNQVYTGKYLFPLSDGGFIATSTILSEGEVNHHLKLYRISSAGQPGWSNEYKQCPEVKVVGMAELPGGMLAFAGSRQDSIMKEGVYWMKTDASGKWLADTTTWWDDDAAMPEKAVSAADGSIIFGGQMQNFKRPYRVFAGSFSAEGKLQWTRTVDDPEGFQDAVDIKKLPDGNLALLTTYSISEAGSRKGVSKVSIMIMPANGGSGTPVDY
jgi:hypothetical protein